MNGEQAVDRDGLAAVVHPVIVAVMRDHGLSGVVLAVARDDQPVEHLLAGEDADGHPLAAGSLFPVASITKLATALTILRLADDGALALDDPLGRYAPEAAAAQPRVTLRALLTHTSGLPARSSWDLATPYDAELTWPAIARACLNVPLHAPPGARDEYTNVGYALLGVVVERVTGRAFAAEVTARVLEPLGVEGYLGTEPSRRPARVAFSDRYAGTPVEPFNSAFFRSLALPGAGLVTTAAGALALVRAFRGIPAGLLRPETLAEATRDQTGDLTGMRRGLGPALSSDFAPAEAGPDAFGHAGGSGCLAWSAPSAGVDWAICTTRALDATGLGPTGWGRPAFQALGSAILSAARGGRPAPG
jgi:CubicO group peptidase (beta-lactamase class C family)